MGYVPDVASNDFRFFVRYVLEHWLILKVMRHLLIARHGRTRESLRGIIMGQRDPPLAPEGREDAYEVAGLLEDLPKPEIIVASDLLRAQQTGILLRSLRGIQGEFLLDSGFREVHFGDLQGRRSDDVRGEIDHYKYDVAYKPQGGESLADATERVQPSLDALLCRKEERGLVVTHAYCAAIIRGILTGHSPLRYMDARPTHRTILSCYKTSGNKWNVDVLKKE